MLRWGDGSFILLLKIINRVSFDSNFMPSPSEFSFAALISYWSFIEYLTTFV